MLINQFVLKVQKNNGDHPVCVEGVKNNGNQPVCVEGVKIMVINQFEKILKCNNNKIC